MRVKWGISKNSDFFHSEKTASFLPIRSFHCHLEMFSMKRNENYNGEIPLKIHFSHSEQICHSRVRLEWRNEAKCDNAPPVLICILFCFELYCTVWNCFEKFWAVLNCFDLFWAVLNCIVLFWIFLNCFKISLTNNVSII